MGSGRSGARLRALIRSWARAIALVLVVALGLSVVEAVAPSPRAVAAGSRAVDPRQVPLLPSEKPGPLRVDPARPAGDFTPLASVNGGARSHFDAKASRVVSRSMFAETYANPDGTRTVRQSSEPLNVADGAGGWVPVDTGLAAETGSGRVRAKAHPLSPSFAAKADDPAVLSVSAGDASASLGIVGAAASASRTDRNLASYGGVQPDTDMAYEVTPGSVKETIVLAKTTGVSSWRFRLNTNGLTPELDRSGAVVLKDRAGKVRMFVPPVEAWDASGSDTAAPALTGGTYGLVREGSGWVLTVSVDAGWLRDPKRVFPVRVDPTVTFGEVEEHAYKSDGTTCDFCGLRVGNSRDNGDTYWRSVFNVNYTSLFGQNVVNARLDLNRNTDTTGSVKTWNTDLYQASAFNFNGVGGYMASGLVGDVGSLQGGGLTTFLQQRVAARDGSGFFMLAGTETPGVWTYKHLSATLTVDTGTAPPAAALVAPADNSVITTLTPTLQVGSVTDPDGDPVTYCFRVATGADAKSGVVVDSGCLPSPQWTVPAGVLQDGVSYTWQAMTYSGNTTTTPAWIGHLKVDQRIGNHGPSPTDDAGPVTVNLANGNVTTSQASPTFTTVGGNAGLTLTFNSQQQDPTGLRASYFNDLSHNGLINPSQQPVLVRTEPQVNVDWGTGSPFPPALGSDWYVVRWEGYFQAPATGSYQFAGVHDDGATVWINGTQVYTSDAPSDVNWTQSTAVPLTAGQRVPIKVELAEKTVVAWMRLFVRTTDGSTVPSQIVPSSWLYTSDVPALPQGWALSADVDGDGSSYTEAKVTDQNVVLTDATGAKHTWAKTSTGGYSPPTGEDGVLGLDNTGRVTLHDGGDVFTFLPDGKLDTQASAVDSRKPAALQNIYNGTPSRLAQIKDPVSGRSHTLHYNRAGDDCYGGVAPPPGADALPPSQMLCRMTYWDGSETRLWYAQGRLAEIEDPGSEMTVYLYDSGGRVTGVLSPQALDWIAVDPGTRNTIDAYTTIGYADQNGKTQATNVTEPAPSLGQARPATTYRYDPANHQTFTDTAGLSPATGFASKVTYDDADRTLSTTDAAGKTSAQEWNVKDQPLSTTDPAGRKTTTVYDYADRPTDSYGPAPASCFTGQIPNGSCAQMSHGHTGYDEGINGLSVAYYDNDSLSGAPKVYATGIGGPDGQLVKNWNSDAPTTGIPADHFSLRATGDITFPASGDYTLRVLADDGVRVWVDDRVVIDDWRNTTAAWRTGVVHNDTPGAGHRIRVDYYDWDLAAQLELHWTTPSNVQEPVPGADLKPRYGLKTSSTAFESDGVPDKIGNTRFDENGLDPVYGLASSGRGNPSGLNITGAVSYEAPGSGYLRKTSKTMATGATTTYAYYGDTETRTNPCVAGSPAVNQGGLPKLTTSTTPASGPARVDEQVYDASGRVVAEATGGAWTCTTYDTRDRPLQETVPATANAPARTVTHNYAVGGDPLTSSVSDDKGTVTTTTDLLGRTVGYTDANGVHTTTVYDQVGRVTSSTVTPPDPADPARVLSFTYDDAGRVLTQKLDNTTLATITYDNAGELASVTYGNGTSLSSVTKDQAARLTSLNWHTSDNHDVLAQVGRTAAGTIVDESLAGVDARPNAPNYLYDGAGRLAEAYVTGHHYTYDFTSTASGTCPAGTQTSAGLNTNRMRLLDQTGTGTAETRYCYDAADRLLATEGATALTGFVYDADGNTTSWTAADGTVTTLGWDGSDRNISAQTTGSPNPALNATITYTRDATNRIIRRDPLNCDNNTVTRYGFTSDGDTPDLTLDGSNRLTSLALSLPGGVLYTSKLGTGGSFTPTYDHPSVRGDLVLATDAAGHQVGQLRTFDPFGQPLTPSGTVDPQNVPDNSPGSMDYGWLGQYQRPYEHTGALSLVQMGDRPYSPLLGRFLSVDPEEGGSANDYDYVVGDPINTLDLNGHGWFSSLVSAVTRVAEVVSWIPGPIGAVASGVAAVGNAIQGNWGAAAAYAFGAVTGGLGSAAVRTFKAVSTVARKVAAPAVRKARAIVGRFAAINRKGKSYGIVYKGPRRGVSIRYDNQYHNFGKRIGRRKHVQVTTWRPAVQKSQRHFRIPIGRRAR